MSSRVALAAVVVLCASLPGVSQTPAPPAPDALVREWFARLNALDGSEDAFRKFVDLYRPEALQQVGPGETQYGPVYLQDRRQIDWWIRDFFATHTPIPETTYFALRVQTVNEKTANVIHATETPWGHQGGAAEFTARYVDRRSGKGFMLSGAAFFQFHAGQIVRLRLYIPREEIMEMTPPFKT